MISIIKWLIGYYSQTLHTVSQQQKFRFFFFRIRDFSVNVKGQWNRTESILKTHQINQGFHLNSDGKMQKPDHSSVRRMKWGPGTSRSSSEWTLSLLHVKASRGGPDPGHVGLEMIIDPPAKVNSKIRWTLICHIIGCVTASISNMTQHKQGEGKRNYCIKNFYSQIKLFKIVDR